ncbi:MAG TPA: universal stress protein [Thermomicrobiaceae bacterium]|nr:universal stress protein [Thermomicrobiaceae bacterium]
MFQAVIVPLDGAELAEAALPYARALAAKLGAGLTLVSVLGDGASASDERQMQAYLAEQAGKLGPGRVDVSLRLGDPVKQIVAASQEHEDAVVVMASQHEHGLSGLFHSSVAAQVVHDSRVPVLVVRAAPTPTGAVNFARILVPLDGSAFAERALPVAEELAHAFDAELQLVRVAAVTQLYALSSGSAIEPGAPAAMAEMSDELIDAARDFIAEKVEQVRGEGYRVQGEALIGDPANQIISFAADRQSDLIVMATHGQGGLMRFLFGSVAKHMLDNATTPLLLVHPTGKVEEETRAQEPG